MHAWNAEIHCTRSSTLLESIKLSAVGCRTSRTIDTIFSPLLFLFLFFLSGERTYRQREGRSIISRDCLSSTRWNCQFRRWFRVPADFHREKSRRPLLETLARHLNAASIDIFFVSVKLKIVAWETIVKSVEENIFAFGSLDFYMEAWRSRNININM